jgi:hypothetical protein
MKQAKVRVYWTKSISIDVVDQSVKATDFSGNVLFNEIFPPSVEEVTFLVPESTSVHVLHLTNDGTYGVEATLDFTIGDLTEPFAATGLGFEILEVVDVPE